MTKNIQIFNNSLFGQIRVATSENNEVMFCASDICGVLGYSNTSKAINDHTEEDERYNESLERGGMLLFINESGLYSLVLRSNKPEAKVFRRWVTSEVLPSIRKHGAYMTVPTIDSMIQNPDAAIKLLTALRDEQTRSNMLSAELERNAPKIAYANTLEASVNSCLVRELAILLTQKGYKIGGNRFYMWLRNNGYLCKSGNSYNQPTQRAMELQLFEITKFPFTTSDGSVRTETTTRVTAKGQQYFINKFLNPKQLTA